MIKIASNNYTFIDFFNKYSYLPRKLKFKYIKFKKSLIFKYIFGLMLKKGFKLYLLKIITTVFMNIHKNHTILNNDNNSNLIFLKNYRNYLVKLTFYRFKLYDYIKKFFLDYKFMFMFFFSKTNKLIFKYSRYKLPKYALYVYYIPYYKRFKILINFFFKSILFKQSNNKIKLLIFKLLYNLENINVFKYIQNLQYFVFKNFKKQLLIQTGKPQRFLNIEKKQEFSVL